MDIRKPLDTNTTLDVLIRDSLVTDAKKASSSDKVFLRLMQRAQTEVAQLPPAQSPAALLETVDAHSVSSRPIVLLQRAPQRAAPPHQSFYDQLTQYRELMELKMWRMVGPLNVAMNV